MKKIIKVCIGYLRNMLALFRIKKIGKGCIFGEKLTINGQFKENIFIGDNVNIGKFSRLGNTILKKNRITIDDNCWIGNYFTAIDGNIEIGKACLIASHVTIIAGNHTLNPVIGYGNGSIDFKDVIIENNVWIGENVVILPGVTIGLYSVIGAGSVVTKSIPQYSLAVGNPAKVIKKYDINQKIWTNV